MLASKEEHLGQMKSALGGKNRCWSTANSDFCIHAARDKEVASLREELSELQARVQQSIDSLHLGLRVQVLTLVVL